MTDKREDQDSSKEKKIRRRRKDRDGETKHRNESGSAHNVEEDGERGGDEHREALDFELVRDHSLDGQKDEDAGHNPYGEHREDGADDLCTRTRNVQPQQT